MFRWPCKDYLKRTCTNSFCTKWHPPECLLYKTKSGCRFGKKCSYAHRQVDEQPSWKVQKEWWQTCSSHEEEWFARNRMAICCQTWQESRKTGETRCQAWYLSWVETRTCWTSIIERTVVSFTTWSRRSLSYGRAQTCRNQSNVWNSRKLLHVTLKFETKILRSDVFAQVNIISAAPTLQNLRVGLIRRQSGKSKVPAKQRGGWPKRVIKIKGARKSHILLTFGKLVFACIKS